MFQSAVGLDEGASIIRFWAPNAKYEDHPQVVGLRLFGKRPSRSLLRLSSLIEWTKPERITHQIDFDILLLVVGSSL